MDGVPDVLGDGEPVQVYRVIRRDLVGDPLVSREEQGRYHDKATDPATSYLSLTPHTAIFESSQGRVEITPERNRLLRVAVHLTEVINLCDPADLAGVGLRRGDLLAPRLQQPHRSRRLKVVRAARVAGAQGVWVPSRLDHPDGINLVLFLEHTPRGRLAEGAVVEIVDEDDLQTFETAIDDVKHSLGENWLHTIHRRAGEV